MSSTQGENKRSNSRQRSGQQARRSGGAVRREVRTRRGSGTSLAVPGNTEKAPAAAATEPTAAESGPPPPQQQQQQQTPGVTPGNEEAQGEGREAAPAAAGKEGDGGEVLSAEEQHKNLLDKIFTTYTGEEILAKMDTMFSGQVGMHPLLCAASVGHLIGMQKLLNVGVDINQQHPPGQSTALHVACKNKQAKAVEMLLNFKADANILDSEGMSAFMLAVESGFCKTLNTMWEHRARFDINLCNKMGKSALHMAAQMSWSCCVSMLLSEGAHVNGASHDGTTALMLASRRGDPRTVETLVEGGANLLLEDNEDCTPICAAIEDHQVEIAKYLIIKLTPSQREEYVKRRVELLYILPNTDDTDTFYEEMLYPVFRLICHNSQCRILLHRFRLIPYWIAAVNNHLENENATEKAFHGMLECLCSGAEIKEDGEDDKEPIRFNHCFVDQFLKNKGTDLVMSALSYYKGSSSTELMAASMLPLLALVDSTSGRKWLEKEYYKITQFISIFEKEYQELEYAAGMKKKVGALWKNFKVMLSGIQAVQAELHGAELVACEEREKARRERKREKKRQRRQLQKAKVTQLTAQYAACSVKVGEDDLQDIDSADDLGTLNSPEGNSKSMKKHLERSCTAGNTSITDGTVSDTSFEEVITRRQAKEIRKMKALKSEENLTPRNKVVPLLSIAQAAVAAKDPKTPVTRKVMRLSAKEDSRETTPERWDAGSEGQKDEGMETEYVTLVERSVVKRLRNLLKDERLSKKPIFCSRRNTPKLEEGCHDVPTSRQIQNGVPKSIVYFETRIDGSPNVRLRPWVELGPNFVLKYTHETFGELSVFTLCAHSPPVISPAVCSCAAPPEADPHDHKRHCVKSAFDVPLLCILETEEEKMREIQMILEASYNLLALADTPEEIGELDDCSIGYTFRKLKRDYVDECRGVLKQFPPELVMVFILNDKFIRIFDPVMKKTPGREQSKARVPEKTIPALLDQPECKDVRDLEENPFMRSITRTSENDHEMNGEMEPSVSTVVCVDLATSAGLTAFPALCIDPAASLAPAAGVFPAADVGNATAAGSAAGIGLTVNVGPEADAALSGNLGPKPGASPGAEIGPGAGSEPVSSAGVSPVSSVGSSTQQTPKSDKKGRKAKRKKGTTLPLQQFLRSTNTSPTSTKECSRSTPSSTRRVKPRALHKEMGETPLSLQQSMHSQTGSRDVQKTKATANEESFVSQLCVSLKGLAKSLEGAVPDEKVVESVDESVDETHESAENTECASDGDKEMTCDNNLKSSSEEQPGGTKAEVTGHGDGHENASPRPQLPVTSVSLNPEQEKSLEAVQIEFGSVNFQIFSSSGVYQPEFVDKASQPVQASVPVNAEPSTQNEALSEKSEASQCSSTEEIEAPKPDSVEVGIINKDVAQPEPLPKSQLLDLSNLRLPDEDDEVEFARLTPDPDVLYDDDKDDDRLFRTVAVTEFWDGKDPIQRLLDAQRDLVRVPGEEIYGYDSRMTRPVTRRLWPEVSGRSPRAQLRAWGGVVPDDDKAGICHYWLPSGLLDTEDVLTERTAAGVKDERLGKPMSCAHVY